MSQKTLTPHRVGLALSGGGARGIMHIGVLQALEEAGIYPQVLSGTSVGSIIGALYASGMKPKEILEIALHAKVRQLFKFILPTLGFAKLTFVENVILRAVPSDQFQDLNLPLHIAVTNLLTGKLEILSSGSLASAVVASCSVPFMFTPKDINGQTYIDGGVLMNLPAEPIREQVDLLIGSSLMPIYPVESKDISSPIAVATRSFTLSSHTNMLHSERLCDVLIEPAAIDNYHIFQLDKALEIYQIGYEETKLKTELIQEKLNANV